MQSLGRVALQALEHQPPEWIPLKKKRFNDLSRKPKEDQQDGSAGKGACC